MKFRIIALILMALTTCAAKEKKAEDYPLKVVVVATSAGSIEHQLSHPNCSMTIQADGDYFYEVSSKDWHCQQFPVGTHLLGRLRSVWGVKFIYLAVPGPKIQEAYYEIHASYYDARGAEKAASAQATATGTVKEQDSEVSVKSKPDGADISVDGKFLGNTPSVLRLSAGEHKVTISIKGFQTWDRNITVSSGTMVTVNANLEPTTQENAR